MLKNCILISLIYIFPSHCIMASIHIHEIIVINVTGSLNKILCNLILFTLIFCWPSEIFIISKLFAWKMFLSSCILKLKLNTVRILIFFCPQEQRRDVLNEDQQPDWKNRWLFCEPSKTYEYLVITFLRQWTYSFPLHWKEVCPI
jgi:hypothetical protein